MALMIGKILVIFILSFIGTGDMKSMDVQKNENIVIRAENWEDFSKEVSKLTKQYDNGGKDRLLVKTVEDGVDFGTYGAVRIIQGPDHYTVLQFENTEAAEKALHTLNALQSVEYAEQDGESYTCN